jgi:DNA polymerase II large subunit
MVGPNGVGARIRELKHMQRVPLAFKIAEEIVYGRFGSMDAEQAAQQAIRTGLAILNEGVTAAPLQGIVKVCIKQRCDEYGRLPKSKYLSIYFAGPMRSAGGTELALVVVLADYVRRLLGLDTYRVTREEAARFMEELRLYEREVARFQFHIDDETIMDVLNHLPVEVTGIKTDQVEVSSYRNIPSIDTNSVRGGALRVINDGLAGRASKVWKNINEMNLTGWDWLKNLKKVKNEKEETESTYLQDIIAGRPVFSFSSLSKHGSRFRLRYGRSRNTGLACIGVHPATMVALNNFIAIGTQLRLETPGKAGIVSSVDTIEPPIVRLKNGSVIRVETVEKATKVRSEVEKILFLGDLLISYAEFLENDKSLVPSSFVEEWWIWELKKALPPNFQDSMEATSNILKISLPRINQLLKDYLTVKPTAEEAVKISETLKIPLHPRYCYFWRNITLENLTDLRCALQKAQLKIEDNMVKQIILDFDPKIKTILEKLLVPHEVNDEKIIVADEAPALAKCLGIEKSNPIKNESKNIFQIVSELAGFEIKDKFSFFIGARMGRPEKAKERKMKPPVHVLFPIGLAGGSQRNIVEAAKKTVEVEIVRRRCLKCGELMIETICPKCQSKTNLERICPRCARPLATEICFHCKTDGKFYDKRIIEIKEQLTKASANLSLNPPDMLKGVKGLTNEKKIPEPLEKGILRARYDLTVFKDGTIRYDITNSPLTHFKPSEIDVPVEKLKQLGYTVDVEGKPLQSQDQLCELKVQDIIIPEKCGDHLVRVAQYIDELLTRFYKLTKFYNINDRKGLLGHLIIGLSPHTSAGVIGRIIGFSKLNVCYSHPLWVSAKRRDCDGDEDSIMLALDVLLNFSREYLPVQIGGIMDAPLLLTPIINPYEVDDQVWTLELCNNLPLEFFYKTIERADPKYIQNLIDMVNHRLGTPAQYEGYSFLHNVSDFNNGVRENIYKKLRTMMEKLQSQMTLVEKIEAVDVKDVAKRVLNVHFMRDIAGNLKIFASQMFRCKRCNAKYRRIPLNGRCLKCGDQLSLTVFKGAVEKYLEAANWLAKTYGLEEYYNQRVKLISDEISMIFVEEKGKMEEEKKETELTEFM